MESRPEHVKYCNTFPQVCFQLRALGVCELGGPLLMRIQWTWGPFPCVTESFSLAAWNLAGFCPDTADTSDLSARRGESSGSRGRQFSGALSRGGKFNRCLPFNHLLLWAPLSLFSPKAVDSGSALPRRSVSSQEEPGRLEWQVLSVQPPLSPLGSSGAIFLCADFIFNENGGDSDPPGRKRVVWVCRP